MSHATLSVTQSRVLAIGLVLLAVISRWLPHPPNMAPMTAVALFSAVFLPRKWSLLVPLTAIFLSDLVLGWYGSVMVVVYSCYVLTGMIGWWVKKTARPGRIAVGTAVASTLFFLLTNAAVWQFGTLYSKDLHGLWLAYVAGLPFFRNSLLGDALYTSILFGLAAIVMMKPEEDTAQKLTLSKSQLAIL